MQIIVTCFSHAVRAIQLDYIKFDAAMKRFFVRKDRSNANSPARDSLESSNTLQIQSSFTPSDRTCIEDDATTSRNAGSTGAGDNKISKKDYWSLAAEELRSEEHAFEGAIVAVQKAVAGTDGDTVSQLIWAAERSRDAMLKKQWRIGLAGKEIAVRDQLEKILKAVKVFKDLLSVAAGLDPTHAAISWAGICLIMQVIGCSLVLKDSHLTYL